VAFRVTVSEGYRTDIPDEPLFPDMASNTLEEKAMPEPTNKPKMVDPAKHDLENTSLSRPEWALDHCSPAKPDYSGNHPIPKSFIDAILEVIAHSIEQALAGVMARCVAENVEQKLRPLSQEIALLRIAIEHDWDDSNQRRRRKPPKIEEVPEG
jgi:hypothetical protein